MTLGGLLVENTVPAGRFFANPANVTAFVTDGTHRMRNVESVIRSILDALLPAYSAPIPAGVALPRYPFEPAFVGPWVVEMSPQLASRLLEKTASLAEYAYADDAVSALLALYLADPIAVLGPYPDGWVP